MRGFKRTVCASTEQLWLQSRQQRCERTYVGKTLPPEAYMRSKPLTRGEADSGAGNPLAASLAPFGAAAWKQGQAVSSKAGSVGKGSHRLIELQVVQDRSPEMAEYTRVFNFQTGDPIECCMLAVLRKSCW